MAQEHPLPFTESFQEAIIGYCITDVNFFMKCYEKIRPQWFTRNAMLADIFEQLSKSYKNNGKFIASIEEFMNEDFFLELSSEDKNKYYNLLQRCIFTRSGKEFDLEKLKKQLTGFLRASKFKESVEGAAKRYRSTNFDETYAWTKQKINEIQDASFEDEIFKVSFANPTVWLKQEKDKSDNGITTGCRALDEALGGGLFKKETCAVMAPSNIGKTTLMTTIVSHLIRTQQKVMFVVHEDNEEKIRLKILLAFLGISKKTLFTEWVTDSKKIEIIEAASKQIEKYLTYVHWCKPGKMYIEDVAQLITKANQEEISRTGRGFDVIVDDYPKKLKSREMKSKEFRIELAYVYDQFNVIAADLNVHCFVALQTNRDGAKQNSGKNETDILLSMENVDESYAAAQNMGNIIALNRTPEDKKAGLLRYSIAKSRNEATDITVITETNYGCSLTHGDKGMFETGGAYVPDIPDGLFSYIQRDNSKIPTDVLVANIDKLKKELVKLEGTQVSTYKESLLA